MKNLFKKYYHSVLRPDEFSEVSDFIGDKKNESIIFSKEIKDESGYVHWEVSSDFSLVEMMEYLYKKEIGSMLVEGGSKIIKSLLELGLWDEARVFIGKGSFGDGVKAQVLPIPAEESIDFSKNLLIITHNRIY